MIPLWLSIPCIIVFLLVVFLWFLTLNIDWKEAFNNAKGIAIQMIIVACGVVAFLSVVQWFMFGVG